MRMKTTYLLIDAGREISEESKFFAVSVGNSKLEKGMCAWLKRWSSERGHFFEKYDHQVTEFVFNIAESLGTKVFLMGIQRFPITTLVHHIRKFNSTPSKAPMTSNCVQLMRAIDPKYFFKTNQQDPK